MAGTLSATAAVVSIFLLFFTLAHADLTDDAASAFLPYSATETKYFTNDTETGITNKAESQTWLPANEINAEIKSSPEKQAKTEKEAEMKPGTVPLTVMSFRPINRHFPLLPFMRRGHKCRHQFQHGQIKPWMVRHISRRERSYGSDMILAGDGRGDGMRHDLVTHGADVRTIPATFSRFPSEHEVRKSHHEHDDHDYHRHRHHDHRRVEGQEYEREERERRHDHGHTRQGDFLRKIRKFLNGF